MQEAAQQLKVGLSVLKRICRQMGLARWPFRTRQSLRGVIAKTQEYYQGVSAGLALQPGTCMSSCMHVTDACHIQLHVTYVVLYLSDHKQKLWKTAAGHQQRKHIRVVEAVSWPCCCREKRLVTESKRRM